MSLIIGVRFTEMGKTYYFDPADFDVEYGDMVLVETTRGREYGEVVLGPSEVEDASILNPLKKILGKSENRKAHRIERNKEKDDEAFRIGAEKIREHKLPMKLIDAQFADNGNQLIFYFAAETRLDFRQLVRDLAYIFKTRIELRQIGARDEARKIGGLGPCGRPCCCNAFLDDFAPVSIRMAKDQGLSLSPTKISGLCGRLMCCLNYEEDHYRCMRKILPRNGTFVETPAGVGTVCHADALTGRTKVKIAYDDESFEMQRFELEDISPYRGEIPPPPQPKKTDASGDHPYRTRGRGPMRSSREAPSERHQASGHRFESDLPEGSTVETDTADARPESRHDSGRRYDSRQTHDAQNGTERSENRRFGGPRTERRSRQDFRRTEDSQQESRGAEDRRRDSRKFAGRADSRRNQSDPSVPHQAEDMRNDTRRSDNGHRQAVGRRQGSRKREDGRPKRTGDPAAERQENTQASAQGQRHSRRPRHKKQPPSSTPKQA